VPPAAAAASLPVPSAAVAPTAKPPPPSSSGKRSALVSERGSGCADAAAATTTTTLIFCRCDQIRTKAGKNKTVCLRSERKKGQLRVKTEKNRTVYLRSEPKEALENAGWGSIFNGSCLLHYVVLNRLGRFGPGLESIVEESDGSRRIPPIERIFVLSVPESIEYFADFATTRSMFCDVKTLVLSVPSIPLPFLTSLLQIAPALETLDVLKYVGLGASFTERDMSLFNSTLASHPRLRAFKFAPKIEAIEVTQNPCRCQDIYCEVCYPYDSDPYVSDDDGSGDELPFRVNAFLKALGKTPNLQLLHFRPSLKSVERFPRHFELGVSLSTLTKLVKNPALVELDIDFRHDWVVWDERYNSPWRRNFCLTADDQSHEQFTNAVEQSKSLTKFSYKSSAWPADVPIVLDVVKALKKNTSLRSVCIQQTDIEQLTGVVSSLADLLTINETLMELRIPHLNINRSEANCSIQPIIESLKQNRSLQVLDVRAGHAILPESYLVRTLFSRGDFLKLLSCQPYEKSNYTLCRLETKDADYDVGMVDLNQPPIDDDSRASCEYDEPLESDVDIALLLNRAGRADLCQNPFPTKADLVKVLANIPSVCRDERDCTERILKDKGEWIWELDEYDDYFDGYFEDMDFDTDCEEDKDHFVSWVEERDNVRANYYFLRTFLPLWAGRPSSSAAAGKQKPKGNLKNDADYDYDCNDSGSVQVPLPPRTKKRKRRCVGRGSKLG